jgi:hypothetical protein
MKKISTTTCLLLFLAASICAQQIIYVKADVQGTGSGLDWANAIPSLQTALSQAYYGTEIRIAAGTYRPTNGVNRDSTFYLKNGFRLRGGFAGEGPTPDIQNPDIYTTILSGDLGVPGDSSDNSYSVMTSSGNMDEGTLLEGLIIEGGSATSDNPNDLWYSHRKSGGGLYIGTGTINNLKVIHCQFRRNTAVGDGTHIFVWQPNGQSSMRVEDCQFEDGKGGSAFRFFGNSKDSIFISHCAFLRHRSLPGLARGVVTVNPQNIIKKVIVENCIFQKNQVGDSIAVTGIVGINGDTVIVKNCLFRDNVHSGSYLLAISGRVDNLLDQDTFLRNKVSYNKGNLIGVGSWPSNPGQRIKNCIFEQNEETNLFYTHYSTNISKCVFRDNLIKRSFFLDESTTGPYKQVVVENSLFERNIYQSLVEFSTYQGSIYPVDNKGWIFTQNFFRENTGLLFDARGHNVTNNISTATWNYCTFSDNRFPNGHSGDTLPYLFHIRNIDLATFNSCIFDQTLLDSSYLFYDSLCHIQLKNNIFKIDSCSQTYRYGAEMNCDTSNFWGLSLIFEDKAAGDYRLTGCSPGINKGDVQLASQLGLNVDLNNGSRVENGLPDIGAFENKLFLQGSVAQYSCVKPASGTLFFDGNTCGPYTYEWWNGMESGTSNIDLPSSKYEVSVTDFHGIVYLDTIFLPEFEPVVIDTILQNPTSITAQDGSIAVPNVFNGLPPYHFNWSTGDSTSVIDDLGVGPYILTITDQLGCQITFLFQLTSITNGTQNIDEEKPQIYLIPNLLSKSSSSRLLYPEGFSEVMIVDALGRVVWSEQVEGTEFMLPAMGYGGIFWVFAKDSESANWLKPLRLVAF